MHLHISLFHSNFSEWPTDLNRIWHSNRHLKNTKFCEVQGKQLLEKGPKKCSHWKQNSGIFMPEF